jgi:hypothetical protein
MALLAKEKGSDFTPAPSGSHVARCIAVIDLGTQYSARFDKESHKVRIMWELPNERKVFSPDKGEEPFVVGKEFTLSLNRNSALRPLLESWRGRAFTAKELEGFELKALLGAPCQLNIIHEEHEGKTYANIASVAPLMKGYTPPPQVIPSRYYELEQGKDAVYAALPEWLREKIDGCVEWKEKTANPDALPTTAELTKGAAKPFNIHDVKDELVEDDLIPF